MPKESLMDEIMPEPFYLPEDEKERSRGLYKEAFPEDTEKFVDFYYTCKTRDNQILALEQDGELVSMVHLNPYTMIVNGFETPVNYIVAVGYRERIPSSRIYASAPGARFAGYGCPEYAFCFSDAGQRTYLCTV